ncbi:MAG: hypothetical protein J6O55_02910 [Lachnospiraceae bacterium]|nr:hypothetical protein [Lachnospiraceae bacterium]
MKKNFGYARVSSRSQKEDRQLIALKENGVVDGMLYIDKQSGKDFGGSLRAVPKAGLIRWNRSVSEGFLSFVLFTNSVNDV